MRSLWQTLRELRRHNVEKKLQALKKNGIQDRHAISVLQVAGRRTYDRQEWLEEACKFGEARFKDDANPFQIQQDRLQRLRAVANADRLDGSAMQLEFWVRRLKLDTPPPPHG